MSIIKALSACFFAVSVCIAQITVTISGQVTDSTGVTPIAGATVRLEKGGLPTTSGADGSFLLSGTTGNINSHSNKPLSGKITASLHNGYMSLSLREKSDVEITLYTIQGKELSSTHKTLDIGSHSVVLPTIAAGVCFYRISAGNEEFVLKSNTLSGISRSTALSNQGTSPTALTRQVESYESINDVILVTKGGYLDYGEQVKNSDTTGIVIKMLPSAGTVTDIDGNVYQTVKIGNQVWTVENLRTTRFNDGAAIPEVTDNSAWSNLTTPGYCYYSNDSAANAVKYGALYNWYTVNTGKLAPAGWHVPTDAEWDTLQNYLIANGYNWDGTTTGNKIAKSMSAKTDWNLSSTAGTPGNDMQSNNSSGFSALPGGCRLNYGSFNSQGNYGLWWSATEYLASYAYYRYLFYVSGDLNRHNYNKEYGFSVRLVRD